MLLYGHDGRIIGTIPYYSTEGIEQTLAPVVSAAAGSTAIVVEPFSEPFGARPDETDVLHTPVAAWRLMNGVATPVLLEETSSSAEVLILLPDGRVMAPGEAIYPSVADAVAAILRDAQIRWDREHAAPEGPAK